MDGVLKHIGAFTQWPLPEQFTNKKVWATTSLVKHERNIPEIVHWYMASQLLRPTERLNELLEGTVSGWVEEMRAITGKSKLSWRILREVNRAVLSLPERLAYEGYHVALDLRMRRRWIALQQSYRTSRLSSCASGAIRL